MRSIQRILLRSMSILLVVSVGVIITTWLSFQALEVTYPEVLNIQQDEMSERFLKGNTPQRVFQSEERFFYEFADGTWETDPTERVMFGGKPQLTPVQRTAVAEKTIIEAPFWHIGDSSNVTISQFNDYIENVQIALAYGFVIGLLFGIVYIFDKDPRITLPTLIFLVLISGAASLIVKVGLVYVIIYAFTAIISLVTISLTRNIG